MSSENELKKLLWHEMGHLCIDLILINKITYKKFYVNELKVFIEPMGNDQYWGGHVQVLPKVGYAETVENLDYLAFKLLTLVSGCVFETVYSKCILKDNNVTFEQCFGIKDSCRGKGDITKFNGLISHLIQLNDEVGKQKIRGNTDIVNFLYKYIPENLTELVKNNVEFLERVNLEVEKIAGKVYKDFEERGKPDDFSETINKTALINLSEIFTTIIKEEEDLENSLEQMKTAFEVELKPFF